VDQRTQSIVARSAVNGSRCGDGRLDATAVESDNILRDALINSLSMRNFVPGSESAHDHFFAAFAKFGAVKKEHNGEFVAEVATRAADQNESYLELMALSGGSVSALGSRVGFDGDFDRTKEKLRQWA
jgi:adenosine deaminase